MITKNPQISIIIPVYNTGRYLEKCLKSIIKQPIFNIEMIIINDASTDNSFDIIRSYSVNDDRIIVINKINNEGLESARKSGLSVAKGTYVFHLDSDDWLVPNTLDIMLKEAVISDADIVTSEMYRVIGNTGYIRQKSAPLFPNKKLVDKEEFMKKYYQNFFGINLFPVTMCGKLYRKSFLDPIDVFPLGHNLGEDLNYNIQVFPKAERILFLPIFLYNYRFGGMTTKFNNNLIDAAIKMYSIKKFYIDQYKLPQLSKYIMIELKNYFRTYIEMQIRFNKNLTETNYNLINEILNTKEYSEVIEFYKNEQYNTDVFVIALINKDGAELVRQSRKRVKKDFFKYTLKRVISKLVIS